MQNKNEGNENKIMLGVLICTMDKIDRDGANKAQRLYRCCFNYALSKRVYLLSPSLSVTTGPLPKISIDRL